MQAALQCQPGAATPIATVSKSADRVVLLLDTKLRDAPFLIHPNTNTQSILVTADRLEAYLQQHGRKAHFADLSVSLSEVKVGPDSPPELKAIANTVAEEKVKGEDKGVAAGTDSKKEKKAARCATLHSSVLTCAALLA